MNINYQFSDVIGAVYKSSSVNFMSDGQTLLCPNGSRIKSFDLKRNISHTFGVESTSNITHFDTNFAGTHAFIATQNNRCLYVNLVKDVVLHEMVVPGRIKAVGFSPNGRYVAIGVSGTVNVYSIASSLTTIRFNPFILVNKFKHSGDHVNSLDWSHDGRLIAAGGENRLVKIFPAQKMNCLNVGVSVLGERAPLINAHFWNDEYDILCIDKSGNVSLWEGSLKPNQLVRSESQPNEKLERLSYNRIMRFNVCQHADPSSSVSVQLTATALNRSKKLLVTAFNNGIFCIFELPSLTLLQNFRISEMKVNSVDLNSNGSWVAITCGQGTESQLVVWEWQSESYILRQQSHSQSITCAAYSPDGSLIATGAEDGKVKVWDCRTSFCLVTFTEHESGTTDICFTQSGKALLSASLEGSVRAHDLKRYRNFRTMVAPKQTQLGLLCADQSGDLVIASSRDHFDIYAWALETGQLLEVLTGHSSLITGLICHESTLFSTSSDKTMKAWDVTKGNCLETIQMLNEGLDVKHSPSQEILAVLCYDSCINLFDTRNTRQLGSIETRLDIDAGRQKWEKIKKSSSERNKTFTSIAFSPDGSLLLAGGQSNTFCLYSVEDRIRIRSFKVSQNLNLDGVNYDINPRNLTEFGNMNLFDLSDSEEEEQNPGKKIRLPGTRHTDLSERGYMPVVCISQLAFSPTGQNFAVVSKEGVSIFSLDRTRRFEPFQLEVGISPSAVIRLSKNGEHTKALSLALKINDSNLIKTIVESIPVEQFGVVARYMELPYAERLLSWIATDPLGLSQSRHFHFYQLLVKELLFANGDGLKKNLAQTRPTITAIQQLMTKQRDLLIKMSNQNLHSLEYLIAVRKMTQLDAQTQNGDEEMLING